MNHKQHADKLWTKIPIILPLIAPLKPLCTLHALLIVLNNNLYNI